MSDHIFRMFGASPIRPMQQHMSKAVACVSELTPFFDAVIKHDLDEMEQIQQRIVTLEHEADVLKKELRLHLPKGLFLPVSRRDLLDVLTMQDNLANKTKDIAGLMLGRKMSLPDSMAKKFIAYVKCSVDATVQAQKAIDEFDELLETGFRGNEVRLVKKLLKTLNKIEDDSDAMQIEVRNQLFQIENDLPPIEVMFIYKIIEKVGEVADTAQRVGSRLQLMLAK
jgi:hypothetical protein